MVGSTSDKCENLQQPIDDIKLEKDYAPPTNAAHISSTTSNQAPCPTLLFIPVTIGKENHTAMLDSGSAVSIMSIDTLLKAHPHASIRSTPITLIAANNTTIEVVGQCRIRLNFGKFSLRVQFIIVDSPLSHHIILGSDWIVGMKADIIMSDKTIRLPDHPPIEFTVASIGTKSQNIAAIRTEKPTTLYPAFLQTFEAGTGGIVLCKIKGMKVPDGSIVCIPTPGDQLDIALTSSRNCVKLPFANVLREDITLWPNEPLASAIIFSPEDIEHVQQAPINATIVGNQADQIPTEPMERFNYLKKELDNMEIPEEYRKTMEDIIKEYHDVFSCGKYDIGKSTLLEMDIETDGTICHTGQYPLAISNQEFADNEIQTMLKHGIISHSTSEYNSPVLVVKKKGGEKRFCNDYRKLNSITRRDRFPLPIIDNVLAQLSGNEFYTCLDVTSGYWQVSVSEKTRPKTAFSTDKGHFEYNVVPFGLTNAPAVFSRLMGRIMAGLVGKILFNYLDDVIVLGKNPTTHVQNIKSALQRFRDASLKLKLSKCSFFQSEVAFLGHKISRHGISPDPMKIQAVKNFQTPRNQKDVLRFLGMTGYYRKFVKNYAFIAKPLYELTKKDYKKKICWSPEAENAFQTLKNHLTCDVLAHPDFTKCFYLHTDASGIGVGGVLSQIDKNGHEKPIAFVSRTLNTAEQRYAAVEQEALAIVFCCTKLRSIILDREVHLRTDNSSMTWVLDKSLSNKGRLARWALLLSEYDLRCKYVRGRAKVVADALSRAPANVSSLRTRPVKDTTRQENISIEWNLQELKELQRASPIYGPIMEYLEGKSPLKPLPKGKSMPIGGFHILDDILYYQDKRFAKDPILRTVLPMKYTPKALELCHSLPCSGHLGMHKTFMRITRYFYWPNCMTDVKKFVNNCKTCQVSKSFNQIKAPVFKFPDIDHPWARVHMDLVGPLTPSNGYHYILVYVDAFSRFCQAVPIVDKSAVTVAKAVYTIMMRFGPPESIVTDNGTEWLNKFFESLCRLFEIKKINICSYHPSSNGQTERYNRSIIQIIRSISSSVEEWADSLETAAMALNSAYHPAIADTPYFILFKQDPRLPFTTLLKDLKPWYNEADDEFNPMVRTNMIYKSVKENIKRYTDKFSHKTNASKKITPVKPGDRVYLKNIPMPNISSKLQPVYKGPFRVVERLSPVRIRVSSLSSGKYYTVHLDNIRLVKEKDMRGKDNDNIGEPYPTADNRDSQEEILVVDEIEENIGQEKIRNHNYNLRRI